jgi:hypothetical protein
VADSVWRQVPLLIAMFGSAGRTVSSAPQEKTMEEVFVRFAVIGERLSEAAAVIVVTFGSLEAFLKLL